MGQITPLLRFLRALDARARGPHGTVINQKKQFAEECGTTLLYLYQLAAQKHPNPTLRLAMLLVARSRAWASKVMTDPLEIEDLLVGVGDDDSPGSDA